MASEAALNIGERTRVVERSETRPEGKRGQARRRQQRRESL